MMEIDSIEPHMPNLTNNSRDLELVENDTFAHPPQLSKSLRVHQIKNFKLS